MKSRQSNKPQVKRKKAKKAVWRTSAANTSSAGRTARESNQFATGIVGKYGFWRNNYLGLLALIFKQNGKHTRKQLAALTDPNDRAWVIQLELLLQNLQHPESAPLITKQQTIRQIEHLMTNAGYKVPTAQALTHRSSSPLDATSAHLQEEQPTEKPVKKRGRKSKKQRETKSSVNHIIDQQMIPESSHEKRVKPDLINHVNKGSLPLINRSIGQIAASIGMVGSTRHSMPEQQSQAVSRHQHTTQNINIQLKNIHLSHRNVFHEKGDPSATRTGLNHAAKTSHINVANHVEAIQQTSRLLEQFQEGKSSVRVLEKQGASSTVPGARGSSSAHGSVNARASTSAITNANANASTSSGQPSVLEVAKQSLNGVVQPQLVSKVQHQQAFVEDRASSSLSASFPKLLPKLGEGPFSTGTAPAAVQFINSLLVRNASKESSAAIDSMLTSHGSDARVERKLEASTSKGFLAASKVPVAINASRLTSTVPFAMHATANLNTSAEAWGGAPSSPRVWRKTQGQEQARLDAQVQAQEQTRMQEQLDMQVLERERVRVQEQERQEQEKQQQLQQLEQDRAKEQEILLTQQSVVNQHTAQLQEQLQILQEQMSHGDEAQKQQNQAETSWQVSANDQEQGVVRAQRLAQEQERAIEQTRLQEQERAQEQQRVQEQERTQEQQRAQEQERAQEQQRVQEQERTQEQQRAQEQERAQEQHRVQEQERAQEQHRVQEHERTQEHQRVQEQERTQEQHRVQEQERAQEQQKVQEQERAQEQQRVQEQERTQEQQKVQEQGKAQNLVQIDAQTEALQQGNRQRSKQVVDHVDDDLAVKRRNVGLGQVGATSSNGKFTNDVSAVHRIIRTAGRMGQSSVMEHPEQPVVNQLSGHKLIHRKPSAMENGAEAAVKIQSNDKMLQQLLQKQRQQSSNDSIVGSTHTNPNLLIRDRSVRNNFTAMTTYKPRMLRGESNQRRHEMTHVDNRQPISQPSQTGRPMDSVKQVGGSRPEAGNIVSPGQGLYQPSNVTSEISANIAKKAENSVTKLVSASPLDGYRASLQASTRLQEAERIFRSPVSNGPSGANHEQQVDNQVAERDADVVQSTLSPINLASEISAKIAESSIAKIGSMFTEMSATNDGNRQHGRTVVENQGQSAEGTRVDLARRSNSFGRIVERIFRKPAEQLTDSSVSLEQTGRSQSIVDPNEKGSNDWIQNGRSSGDFAAEIASKITENSLKSMGPSLVPAAAAIGMVRNRQLDAVLRQQSPVSAVQAIWKQREGQSSPDRKVEPESSNRTVYVKEFIETAATAASESSPGVARRRPSSATSGLETSVSMVGRATKGSSDERASTSLGRVGTFGSNLVDAGRLTEVHRLMEAEAHAKLQLQAGSAMQSRKQPAMGVRRGAQVEHIQRQTLAAENDRAQRARSGSLNQSEAGSFLSDSAERTIRALSALEEARTQAEQPAAASRAAARADARMTRASMARQPASMTPRVMPLLASSAGARIAAPAGTAAASPAAAVHLLPAHGTGSFTQAAAIGRAAASTGAPQAGAPSTLLPSIGSSITSARQEHLASQQPTLEHKQAPAAPVPNSALADAPLEMDWLRTKASADEAQPPAAPVPQAPPELTSEQLQELVKQIPQLDVTKIADKVFREIEKRMKFEQQRRGF
ncbi:hypothetical protein HZF08_32305 [Paenibacillus sp. CGMCC 1.16610]|uniref:Uncharacterized protein n=1 Tax=Paenibacillus anseongense TaxID=2682845 RepID=A0ABW9U1P6_9BACL|nr:MULTISPECIES: hypothetical protein [Paenibacillus]MBA2942949.1 hypothetical protein [Paenibacillus sp. CGMCC 1.16610]MVQ33446.1 hypothetical protein [Paenibacillus anseongense]